MKKQDTNKSKKGMNCEEFIRFLQKKQAEKTKRTKNVLDFLSSIG